MTNHIIPAGELQDYIPRGDSDLTIEDEWLQGFQQRPSKTFKCRSTERLIMAESCQSSIVAHGRFQLDYRLCHFAF